MNQEKAAAIVGCSHAQVPNLVKEGLLVQRPGPRWLASISRPSAEKAAVVWAQRQSRIEEEREQRRARRPSNGPPDDGNVWLSTSTAALMLGMSQNQVGRRVRNETLPGVRRGNRYWLRRDVVERVAAARAFGRRRLETAP